MRERGGEREAWGGQMLTTTKIVTIKQKGDGDENNNSDDKDGNAGRDDGWSVMKGNGK